MSNALPHWQLNDLYPSLDSPKLKADLQKIKDSLAIVAKYEFPPVPATPETLAGELKKMLKWEEELADPVEAISVYCHALITTDSYNSEAVKIESSLSGAMVALSLLNVRYLKWLAAIPEKLWKEFWASDASKDLKDFQFALNEERDNASHLLSEKEEELAARLEQCGTHAWAKLQGLITSRATAEFTYKGETKRLPLTALRAYQTDSDPDVRLNAQKTEEAAWKQLEDQVAACLNGVKGSANTMAKARGYSSALEQSLRISRLDDETFSALWDAMERSFPLFRRYFVSKAKKLGLPKLRWCDLDAPAGDSSRKYSIEDCQAFLYRHFESFSPELRDLAKRAFENNWIDAEPRDGKRGGAFCMPVRKLEESRILANYACNFDSVNCLAHELGHAFHNYCMKGLPMKQRKCPMTLAETASIMDEMIVSESALKEARSKEEELYILESAIASTSGVIVDIASRFLFEKEVMERRLESELTASELCAIMEKAQKATFGDALDEKCLGPYMWTWKPHYYYSGFNFYNYPYAFGRLFAMALYSLYRKEGAAFVPKYMDFLRSAGQASPRELAARFGYNITRKEFWDNSLAVVEGWVKRYEEL